MGRKNKKSRGDGGGAGNSGLNHAQKRELKDCIDKVLDVCTKPQSTGPKEWEEYIELHQVIERVQQLQAGTETNAANRTDKFEAFFDWLNTQGVDTQNVCISEFKGYGYGLKAKKDFKTADMFLSIPRKLMMTTESAKLSPLGPFMSDDKILQSMPNVALSLHLLCEKYTENSFWAPYINVLPSSYNTPLYYTPEDLQLLKGSPTQGEAISQFRNITRQYAYFYRHLQMNPLAAKLPIKDLFTFDDYRWAVSTVMTRQNPIPSVDGGHMTYGLIPLWDMCNHQNGQLSTDFNLETDKGECYSMRDFKAAEQIFIFYGARSNGEFFVHNGFIYKENEHDSLSIKLGISKNDPLFSLKSELLGKIGMLSSRNFCLHMGSEAVDTELLAFLRIFVLDEDSLKTKFKDKESPELLEILGGAESPLGPELEVKAWTFLETRASLLLKMYPSSIEAYTSKEHRGNLSGSPASIVRGALVTVGNGQRSLLCRVTRRMIAEDFFHDTPSYREELYDPSYDGVLYVGEYARYSPKEDEELLTQDLSEMKMAAVLLRQLEKRLLMNTIQYTQEIKGRLPLKQ